VRRENTRSHSDLDMWNRLAPYVLRLFGRHGLRSDKKELRIVKKRWGEKAEWETYHAGIKVAWVNLFKCYEISLIS